MNRAMRQASEAEGRRLQKLAWNKFEDVTFEPRTIEILSRMDYKIDKVYRNNKYIVMVYYNEEKNNKLYTKVMCRRSDSKPIYSWQDLYRIKNEIFGEETEAIQLLPKASELIDEANLYWFFIEQ
jgi:hypothetical protein